MAATRRRGFRLLRPAPEGHLEAGGHPLPRLRGPSPVRRHQRSHGDQRLQRPTAENLAAQNGFNQVFVSTVRSTGGRNAYRYLVVQGFNTNIAYTVTGFKTPKDAASKRLFLEYHFYDPYDFTINTGNTTATEWGNSAPAAKTAGWGNETYVDTILARMKTTFGNNGIR
jgi:hypothetical protein